MLSRLVQALHRLPRFPGQWRLAGLLRKALPGGIGLYADTGGIRYFVHDGSHVGHMLAVGRAGEPEIERLVPDGALGLVVDLGCNAGTFALPLARRARLIVCVDADGEQIGLLRRSCALNGIANVVAVHAAITSRAVPTETFHVARSLKDLSSRDAGMLRGRDDYATVEVPALAVEAIVRQYGPIDLLKIDIEGFSGDAIVSLRARIADVRRIIAEPSPDMPEAVAFLRRNGFRVSQPWADRTDLADHIRHTFLAERQEPVP